MKPTRRTQPYRANKPRKPTGALSAMLAGAAMNRPHPKQAEREAQKQLKRRRRRSHVPAKRR